MMEDYDRSISELGHQHHGWEKVDAECQKEINSQSLPLHRTERQLYDLFDAVWHKFYTGVKEENKNILTEAENLVLWNGPDWLQDIGYWRQQEGKK